jgi:beta-aspartyl-dipeptidase (metallo-type)
MLLAIENGRILNPSPAGFQTVLVSGERIERVGGVDLGLVEKAGLPVQRIDATDCWVVPGFIDPHQHLLGGSGEQGWGSQTPEVFLKEIAEAGITTVVGCLGVDTITKTMPGLLARARALQEGGLTTYIYSGGYDVPPRTLIGSLRADMLMIPEVIGAGEIAISDMRSTEPTIHELARLCRDAYVGGLLTRKAGVVHFHVGDGRARLAPIRRLLQEHEVSPSQLYPTHVERNEELMLEAVALSTRGVTVDIDTVEQDLPKWVRFFQEHGGDRAFLTLSSDAAISSPRTLAEQIRACVLETGYPLERVLPLVTTNTARTLKLSGKGKIEPGFDADLLILTSSLDIRDVIARGQILVRNGHLCVNEAFLKNSNRRIDLNGEKQ